MNLFRAAPFADIPYVYLFLIPYFRNIHFGNASSYLPLMYLKMLISASEIQANEQGSSTRMILNVTGDFAVTLIRRDKQLKQLAVDVHTPSSSATLAFSQCNSHVTRVKHRSAATTITPPQLEPH
jgi:hypothetical protein